VLRDSARIVARPFSNRISDFHQDVQTATGGLSPGLGINLSERFSLEGSAVIDRVETERVVTYEVSLVINRARRPRSRWIRFLRLGGGGHYEFEHVTESQHQNQDRSISAYPAYDHKKLTGPNFFVITTGIRYLAGRHVAIRAEGGGVIGSPGFGIQASAGIVIPIGSFVLP
jgi:hypothetical protein